MSTNKKRISRLIELFENNANWNDEDIKDFGYDFNKKTHFYNYDGSWMDLFIECFRLEKGEQIYKDKVSYKIRLSVAKYLGYLEYYYFYKKIISSKKFLNLKISKLSSLNDEEITALKIFVDLKDNPSLNKKEIKKGRKENKHRDLFAMELFKLYKSFYDDSFFYADFFKWVISPLENLDRYKKESIGTVRYKRSINAWKDICIKIQK
ncbi:MAG: hypothetical protein KGQ36_04270 [Rickettsiales bacterium]|nr:hypothetical protein [Rickettsiales bacterium]